MSKLYTQTPHSTNNKNLSIIYNLIKYGRLAGAELLNLF